MFLPGIVGVTYQIRHVRGIEFNDRFKGDKFGGRFWAWAELADVQDGRADCHLFEWMGYMVNIWLIYG